MTKRIREGLGVLCVAGVCLIVGIALKQNDDGTIAEVIGSALVVGAILFGVSGLSMIAVDLFRKQPAD